MLSCPTFDEDSKFKVNHGRLAKKGEFDFVVEIDRNEKFRDGECTGGGSDILGEITTVSLKVSATWVSLPVCSELVKEMYVRGDLSTRDIATILGISKSTALTRLWSTSVELRPRGRKDL